MYLRNFGRCSTSRISPSTAEDRQTVSCDRARSSARSGIESVLSAAPTIELTSKTTFGIIDGEFRFDLFVGKPIGACGALNRRENRSQRIVSRGLRAQQAANEFSDALAPLGVSECLGRLRCDRDFNH